jgi:hypothetical protein
MNKLSKKLILPSLATLLFFNAQLFADEEIAENTETSIDQHVSVRSREMDPAKRESIQSQRAQERQEEETDGKTEAQQTLRKVSYKFAAADASTPFMLAPRETMTRPKIAMAAYNYPINCHWLTSIADNNRSIEIEDGSHWEVAASDSYILRNWRREDAIVVTPNYSWFSSYDYYLTNKSNNTFVKANLYVGPLAYGPYSHWIVDIDLFGGHVFLENKMIWCIDPQDTNVIKDWAVNDHIILGIYDSWFSPYDHILINVNMDDHARVKQY